MIKVIKIIILLIAETVCLITFVAMCFNNRTLQSVVPRAQWHQNPTTENRLAYEQAGRDELRFLWTVRGGLGLALLWNSWALARVLRHDKKNAANKAMEAIVNRGRFTHPHG